jgi:hypothetical protein
MVPGTWVLKALTIREPCFGLPKLCLPFLALCPAVFMDGPHPPQSQAWPLTLTPGSGRR